MSAVLIGCAAAIGNGAGAAARHHHKSNVERGAEGSKKRLFAANGIWNRRLDPKIPLDQNSKRVVAGFVAEARRQLSEGAGPNINTTAYSVPIYTVPRHQPVVPVHLTTPGANSLRRAWRQVPLPPDAHPADGSDAQLVVWQPSTDRLWEFWRLSSSSTGWSAIWGGAINGVSDNSGVYTPAAWPGASRSWGASASSLSIAGGVITLEDLQNGAIHHALAIAAPNVRRRVFATPAQRTDGMSNWRYAIPEGARLRLPPKLKLDPDIPRITSMIARAAKHYGIVVRDNAPSGITSFFAQDPTSTGSNPYRGPDGYFDGIYPTRLLASFPWSHLQLVRMHLRQASVP